MEKNKKFYALSIVLVMLIVVGTILGYVIGTHSINECDAPTDRSAMDSIWYASNDCILLEDLGSDSFILFEILEDDVSIKFYPRTREGLFDLSMENTEIFFHMIDTSWNFEDS